MKAYTSDSLRDNLNNGCLSWGEGKTVLYCNDIIYGWKSSNVLIESYDNNLWLNRYIGDLLIYSTLIMSI